MKLREIVKSKEMSKDLTRKDTITQNYLERTTRTRYRIGDYPVYEFKPPGRQTKLMLFVASPDGKELLGQMALLRYPHRDSTYMFSEVYFDPSIQGKGIAVPLYKIAVLRYGLTIVSDESQTEGSEKLWNRLARDPEVHVYVWDTQKDNYREFDPDDPDDVYFDKQEIKQLEQEAEEISTRLRDQYMSGEIDSNEYDELLRRYINPIHDDIEAIVRADDMRLVATKDDR